MPDKVPRISLVTPCLNAARWLEGCLESVARQNDPAVEHWVVDGGSTDGTVEILRRWEPRLAGWFRQEGGGLSSAINQGLARCTGMYFNWLNADDRLLPGALAALRAGFDRHPGAVFVAGWMRRVDEAGQPWEERNQARNRTDAFPPPGLVDLSEAMSRLKMPEQPAGLFLTAAVRRCGGLREDLEVTMDLNLTLRLALHGFCVQLPVETVEFRKHPSQISARVDERYAAEPARIVEDLLRLPEAGILRRGLHGRMRAAACRHAARIHAEAGRPHAAFAATLAEVRHQPGWGLKLTALRRAFRRLRGAA